MGLTQAELSEKIGYSDKSISKWERGESIPDVPTLLALANVFGVSLDDFVDSTRQLSPQQPTRPLSPQKSFTWKHCFITLLSAGGVLAAAILTICLFQFLSPSLTKIRTSRILCYAAAGFFLVWLVLACLWWPFAWRMLAITGAIWSAAVSVHVTFHPTYAITLYLAAGILQILVAICYLWKCIAEKRVLKLSFFD